VQQFLWCITLPLSLSCIQPELTHHQDQPSSHTVHTNLAVPHFVQTETKTYTAKLTLAVEMWQCPHQRAHVHVFGYVELLASELNHTNVSYPDSSEYDKLHLLLQTQHVYLDHFDFCLDDTGKKQEHIHTT